MGISNQIDTKDGRKATLSRSEEHTSELQSLTNLVCRLLLEKKNKYSLRALPSDSYVSLCTLNVIPSYGRPNSHCPRYTVRQQTETLFGPDFNSLSSPLHRC